MKIILTIVLVSLSLCAFSREKLDLKPTYTIVADSTDKDVPRGKTKLELRLNPFYVDTGDGLGVFEGLEVYLYDRALDGANILIGKFDRSGSMIVEVPANKAIQLIIEDPDTIQNSDGILVDGFERVVTNEIELKSKHHIVIEFNMSNAGAYIIVDKPVVYLYPEDKTEVSVRIKPFGDLYFTYPAYNDGWEVTAYPDGHLVSKGRTYNYLFWEGKFDVIAMTAEEFETGFVIKGADLLEFFESVLPKIGLTPREYNDFIVYWTPKMQENEYNFIHFKFNDQYASDIAEMEISPNPASVLRVFMVYKPLNERIEVEEQDIPGFSRKGFAVIEWGGAELPKNSKSL